MLSHHLNGAENSRNYGIDLLRIVAMIMIPIMHVLGHGGVRDATAPLCMRYGLAWLLDIACFCAVNVYALISGYVGYGRKHKYANLINLSIQVAFYTVLTTVTVKFVMPDTVSWKEVLKAFLPGPLGTYWYFTAYMCLFFFMPFQSCLDRLDRSTMRKLLFAMALVFSVLPTLFLRDMSGTLSGYSFLWLAVMYLIGAYIKKYNVADAFQKKTCILGYLLCVAVTWLSKFGMETLSNHFFSEPKWGGYLLAYTSPTIVLSALFLLLLFAKLSLPPITVKVVAFFAPVSFDVYLLHEEPQIRELFINGRFQRLADLHPIVMILSVIGIAICIWLIGSVIGRIRMVIFKMFRIKQLSEWIERKGRCVLKRLSKVILPEQF